MRANISKLDSSIAFLAIIVMSMYLRFSDILAVKLLLEVMIFMHLGICWLIGIKMDSPISARKISLICIVGGLLFLIQPVWLEFKNVDLREIYMPLISLLAGSIIWRLSDRRDVNQGRDRRKNTI